MRGCGRVRECESVLLYRIAAVTRMRRLFDSFTEVQLRLRREVVGVRVHSVSVFARVGHLL